MSESLTFQAPGLIALRAPRGLPGLAPLELEMFEIIRAEQRIDEIAIVNAIRAPELLKTFNKAYLQLRQYISALEFEYETAVKYQGEVRATIILDDAPRVLRERNLVSEKNPSGSVDQREAVVALDERFKKISEVVNSLKCFISLLEGKKDAIEKAYTSVKRILPDNSTRRPNPNLVVTPHGGS